MKTKFYSHFVALALLAVVHPAPAQPTLGMVLTNNQVLLYWSPSYTGYILQSSTDPSSTNWVPATGVFPAAHSSQSAVTVSNSTQAQFFRLFQLPTTPDGMVLIPAGPFVIGDTLDSNIDNMTYGDNFATNVYVSAFYMDTNLVSYSRWQTVYTYATGHGYGFDNAGSGKAMNHPVCVVNWYDVIKWCNARSRLAGRTPVYYTDAGLTQTYTNGQVLDPFVNWSANGYRLPTEAEWEKAARGGLSGQRFPWGDIIFENQANYKGSTNQYSYDWGPYNGFNTNFNTGAFPYTSPVGYFAPNGYGLYDMAGNLSEWCWDWYAGPPYPIGSPYAGGSDPHGPVSSSPANSRVARGGYWGDTAFESCCAARVAWNVLNNYTSTGFRCVRKP